MMYRAWHRQEQRFLDPEEVSVRGNGDVWYEVDGVWRQDHDHEGIVIELCHERTGIYHGDIIGPVAENHEPDDRRLVAMSLEDNQFHILPHYEPRDFSELAERGRMDVVGNMHENNDLMPGKVYFDHKYGEWVEVVR